MPGEKCGLNILYNKSRDHGEEVFPGVPVPNAMAPSRIYHEGKLFLGSNQGIDQQSRVLEMDVVVRQSVHKEKFTFQLSAFIKE